MKVYFNIDNFESHKFTKKGSEKILLLDFKHGCFKFKDRIVSDEMRKNGALIDENTGHEYSGDYHDVCVYNYNYCLRKPRTAQGYKYYMPSSYIVHIRMTPDDYNELK